MRTSVIVTAMVEHELTLGLPFWVSGRVQAHLPEQVESPVPGSSVIGSTALVGLEHRWGQ